MGEADIIDASEMSCWAVAPIAVNRRRNKFGVFDKSREFRSQILFHVQYIDFTVLHVFSSPLQPMCVVLSGAKVPNGT